MHATKRAHKITQSGPNPFHGVRVDLTNSIAVIVSGILFLRVANGGMRTPGGGDFIVSGGFIRIKRYGV
jgi:hypothetical protein